MIVCPGFGVGDEDVYAMEDFGPGVKGARLVVGPAPYAGYVLMSPTGFTQ